MVGGDQLRYDRIRCARSSFDGLLALTLAERGGFPCVDSEFQKQTTGLAFRLYTIYPHLSSQQIGGHLTHLPSYVACSVRPLLTSVDCPDQSLEIAQRALYRASLTKTAHTRANQFRGGGSSALWVQA